MKYKERLRLVLLVGFLGLRLGLEYAFWRTISPYYSYGFELAFIVLVFKVYPGSFTMGSITNTQTPMGLFVAIASGALICKLIASAGIPIPWDVNQIEVVFLLLLLAPMLEELVFRYALWELLKLPRFTVSERIVWSAGIFSLGHFVAFLTIPDLFKPFLVCQVLYVMMLGLYNPANEGGILWNDPSLAIKWPVGNPSLSGRDQKLSTFADYSKNPVF